MSSATAVRAIRFSAHSDSPNSPSPVPISVVRTKAIRDRVVTLFNRMAERKFEGASVLYDQHMNSDTDHSAEIKKALDELRRLLLLKRLRSADGLRVLVVGGGTAELESHFIRNHCLPILRSDPNAKVTLVFTDAASNMVAIARSKIESARLQANGAGARIQSTFISAPAEVLTDCDFTGQHPEFNAGFDLAIASYVSVWFGDRERAYSNVFELLKARRGRLLSIEENPLVLTPSTSLPEEFSAMLEIVREAHLPPRELNNFLRNIGFEIRNTDIGSPLAIDIAHSVYARVARTG